MSVSMARDGCKKAIHSWELHDKAIRKAEALASPQPQEKIQAMQSVLEGSKGEFWRKELGELDGARGASRIAGARGAPRLSEMSC